MRREGREGREGERKSMEPFLQALSLKHGEWNILELPQRQRQVDPWELDQDQLRCL